MSRARSPSSWSAGSMSSVEDVSQNSSDKTASRQEIEPRLINRAYFEEEESSGQSGTSGRSTPHVTVHNSSVATPSRHIPMEPLKYLKDATPNIFKSDIAASGSVVADRSSYPSEPPPYNEIGPFLYNKSPGMFDKTKSYSESNADPGQTTRYNASENPSYPSSSSTTSSALSKHPNKTSSSYSRTDISASSTRSRSTGISSRSSKSHNISNSISSALHFPASSKHLSREYYRSPKSQSSLSPIGSGAIYDQHKASTEAAVPSKVRTLDDSEGLIVLSTILSTTNINAIYSYAKIMAQLIFEAVRPYYEDHSSTKEVVVALPELLEEFAVRLEDRNSDNLYTGIAVSVYRHREDIATAYSRLQDRSEDILTLSSNDTIHIQGQSTSTDAVEFSNSRLLERQTQNRGQRLRRDEETTQTAGSTSNASTIETMLAWMDHTARSYLERDSSLGEIETSLLNVLRSLLVKDLSYEWLVSRLQRVISCTFGEAQMSIAKFVRETLDFVNVASTRMSVASSRMLAQFRSSGPLDTSTMSNISVDLNWNVQDFLRKEFPVSDTTKYSNSPRIDNLGNIVTITGSVDNCQLLTCREYLQLIWPQLGHEVLLGLQMFIFGGEEETVRLADVVNMDIHWSRGYLKVDLEGPLYYISEIVDILAWLSTALQAPISGISGYSPRITSISKQDSIRVFALRSRQVSLANANGSCWHNMLHSSAVVLGYPIRCRPRADGLEISLDLISELLCSKRVNVFNGKLLLKSFSAMLLPTKRSKDVIQWHYVYSEKGEYLDFSVAESYDYGAGVIENDLHLRHIIGWCSDAKVIAGAPGQHYSIQRSRLSKTKTSIALKSFNLSAGTQPGASLGATVTIGIKDRPLHVYPAGYGIIQKLRWISEKHVVLYDAEEQRGWLIDGLSALLHLLRTSLHSYSMDKFNSAFKLKLEHILEPTGDYPGAAVDFFLENDCKNLQLELFVKRFESVTENMGSGTGVSKLRTTSVLLQDRVEDLWEILAHAITQQAEIARQDGIYYKPRFRKTLDGWDFLNIATGLSLFEPVAATLDCFQQPWVDMIRALNIPVLFGQGFGEIIQPTQSDKKACSNWQTLPKGKSYLAAMTATMREIMDIHGDEAMRPMKVCDNILWFTPSANNAACKCLDRKDGRHIDNVQVLCLEGLKSKIIGNMNLAAPALPVNGAFVFGHNNSFGWTRSEIGTVSEKSGEHSQNAIQESSNEHSKTSSEENNLNALGSSATSDQSTDPTDRNGSASASQTSMSTRSNDLKHKAGFVGKSGKKETLGIRPRSYLSSVFHAFSKSNSAEHS